MVEPTYSTIGEFADAYKIERRELNRRSCWVSSNPAGNAETPYCPRRT